MRVRGAVKSAFVLMMCLAAATAAFLFLRAPVFYGGSGYELYMEPNSSSELIRTDDPVLIKLSLRTRGESARLEGDRREELIEAFHARLLFEEQTCGTTHLYLYSPLLGEGVFIGGYTVNLHIAFTPSPSTDPTSPPQTVVGTPLIFGST